MKLVRILLYLLMFHQTLIAQNGTGTLSIGQTDSVTKEKARNKQIYGGPRKAAILSAVLPGLGQVYNKKVWKVPIIYGGLAGLGYFFVSNNTQYNFYRKNLIAFYDEDSTTLNTTPYSGEQLKTQKLYYRKYRDYAAIGMGLIYLLNIIDAHVDAHLKTFDVSDDLSLRIEPWHTGINLNGQTHTVKGLSLKLTFK